jgi:radical SAM superfamily enzyme YgiQ (UPF0313 family)
MATHLVEYDQIYYSSIFDFTKKHYVAPGATIGGTGFDLVTVLPPEIEAMKPRLNIGFTNRGCIRKCSFCVVPIKEGYIHPVGDLLDIWDGHSRDITLYDNNILGLPDHFEAICNQARAHKLRLDFNQGLDHRLLTPELVAILKKTSHQQLRFAFDHPAELQTVLKAIEMLKAQKINQSMWYVLVGYNTTFKQDMDRVKLLKELGQRPYIMMYKGNKNHPELGLDSHMKKIRALARYTNRMNVGTGMTWCQFLSCPENFYMKKYLTIEEREVC